MHVKFNSFNDIALSLSGINSFSDKEIEANNNKILRNLIFLNMVKKLYKHKYFNFATFFDNFIIIN